jgi:signal transduction histidine kinase
MRISRDFGLGAVVLGTGLLLTGVFFLFPQNGDAQYATYEAIAGIAVVSIAAGVRRFRPQPVWPWAVFAGGIVLFIGGDILTDAYPNSATPSAADWLYLAGYPLLAAAIFMLVVSSGAHRRIGALLDTAVVTLGFAVFQWIFVMQPALHMHAPEGQRIVLGVLYPIMDIALLGAAAGFFSSPAWRTPAFAFLVAGLAIQLLGDEFESVKGPYYSLGVWINLPFMASYLFWGVAALHPSMTKLSQPGRETAFRVTPWRVAALTLALLTPPVARVVADERGRDVGVGVVAALSVAIALLVIARMAEMLVSLDRTRNRLSEQNVELVEADRLKDEFIALVSHDLRTPLTSIIGYVELALDEADSAPLDEERRRYLEVVARSSDRLLRLVDDLLLAARLQSGRFVLNSAETDLAAVAAEALDEMHARAERKGVSLFLTSEGPVRIECDRRRVLQLVDNLVGNAIKFTREGGRVELRVERTLVGAAVEVTDTGVGIEPGDEERIFDRFYRSARAVTEHVPGTGLGLFIARAIAEHHGGRLFARRRDGGGSTFRLELPSVAIRATVDAQSELVA